MYNAISNFIILNFKIPMQVDITFNDLKDFLMFQLMMIMINAGNITQREEKNGQNKIPKSLQNAQYLSFVPNLVSLVL